MIYSTVKIQKLDDVYIRLHCEPSVAQELSDYFTFIPDNAKWSAAYQRRDRYGRRLWDGVIRLFSLRTHTILAGLRHEIEKFCASRGYAVEHMGDFSENEFSLKEGLEFVEALELPENRFPRDYQLAAFVKCVRQKRRLTLLPTASGKSLTIYLVSRYLPGKKLIIVPTLALIHQMVGDFISYGCDPSMCHKVFSGQDKNSNREIVVSTWQSLQRLPKAWFEQFSVVIGDEAHGFKAKMLTSIMGRLDHCEYRFGFSGTLDGTQCNEMVLTGLFGPIRRGVTTKELIDRGTLAQLKIKMIVLKHDAETRERLQFAEYRDEMEYIIGCERRNRFIRNLALSLEGNTLILFQFVEKHGKVLHEMIKGAAEEGRRIFFVHGGVPGEDRDVIRSIVEKEKNAIIIASRGTFSTGINIQNIHSIIFASPLKARISNLQSIGRGLRKSDIKTICTVYDLIDDLSSPHWRNHTLKHAEMRAQIYHSEGFPFRTYKVALNGKQGLSS